MSFPLYIILFIYLLFLLIWLIFSLVGLYHMLKFGFLNFTTFFAVFFYIAVSLMILSVSYNFIVAIDWRTNVSMFNGFFENNNFFPR
jgi:hypothetical protein